MQYLNREAAKIVALSSCKINKYEYPTGEKMLPSDQSRMTEQTRFTYSPLGKALEKQTNEDQGKNKHAIMNQNKRQCHKKYLKNFLEKGLMK